jgi:hypothetical protein
MKKIVLKIIPFIGLCICGCNKPNQELSYIRIAHVGAQDSPFHTLLLSTDSIRIDSNLWLFNMVISPLALGEIQRMAQVLKEDTTSMNAYPVPYSGFNVSECYTNKLCIDKRINIDEAVIYYESILRILRKYNVDNKDNDVVNKMRYLQDKADGTYGGGKYIFK